jgi:hypothetical protein
VRASADQRRIHRFLATLGKRLHRPIRLYLVGGAVLVHSGLREATLDIDFVARSDDPQAEAEFERLLPELKERLNVNAEPASPGDFLPVPTDVLDRSRFVGRHGQVDVYYYHLPTLALAKVARSAERDIADIQRLIQAGLIKWDDVEAVWQEVRTRERGWLRATPAKVERRMQAMRQRLAQDPPEPL